MTKIEARAGYFEAQGGRLYFETAGEGGAIVFVHGFTLDTRMWDDQWRFFSESHRVTRYDVRGFGRSSKPAGPYANSRDLKALLDHLKAERPHVVGLSMGGGIAVDYALSYPEGLRSLTLIDSTLGGYPHFSEEFHASTNLADVARTAGVDVAKAAWTAHPFFEPASRNPAVWERLCAIVGEWDGWQWLNKNRQEPLEPPAAQRLHEIKVPHLGPGRRAGHTGLPCRRALPGRGDQWRAAQADRGRGPHGQHGAAASGQRRHRRVPGVEFVKR